MRFRTLREISSSEGDVQLVEQTITRSHVKGTDLILVPTPTEDPNDPVTWPQWKKHVIFLIISFFTFMTNGSISGITPGFVKLSAEFSKSMPETANLMIYTPLAGGLGNFLWVPLSKKYGKRLVFVLTSLVLFLSNIWSAKSTSYGSLLAARLIGFFCGASTESVGVVVIDDLFFLHERGLHVGVYGTALSWGNAIGPLFGGFVIETIGWRWFCWICSIASGLNFLAIFFFVPETHYRRPQNESSGPEICPPGSMTEGKTQEDEETLEKKHPDHTGEVDKANVLSRKPTGPHRETASGCQSGQVFVKKSYFQSLSVWNGVADETNFLKLFLRPFPLLSYPAVIWGTLTLSLALGAVVAASTLNSFILQAPPYNFRPGTNGLINIAGAIGNLMGAITAGPVTDFVSQWHARRHGGMFIPESRLIVLVLPAMMTMVGQLLFGFGAERHLHYIVIFVGFGIINYVVSSITGLAIIYAMDSYHAVAAEAVAMLNGFKSMFAFGFSYAIVPWVETSGYAKSFAAMGGIILFSELFAIFFYIWGGAIRHWTICNLRVISW